ncbi:NAD-binding protein [Nonomuraea soli]|uniref:Uncharacterized protein (TIGR02246 family) n=1 Tax=Nonomuraea soli TaxID=1032476 RepID=A0A7W0CUT5_9ACTN|nr:NAD-binding protein [Nonomuraea soli]MBA2897711.1 uncharacterized protein (TIGR02246 family) [Nonomuraea soli]
MIDAPVSGSVSMAEAASLTVMVGASAEQYERIRPLLATLSAAQHHVGPAGAGSAAKLAVNTVLAALNQATAEGLLMAEATGLDLAAFYGVLRDSAAGAPYVGYKQKAFLAPETAEIAAPMSLIRKDLGLALDLARGRRLTLPVSEAAYALLEETVAAGLGHRDMAGVLEALRRRPHPLDGTRQHQGNPGMTDAAPGCADIETTIRSLEDARYAAMTAGDVEAFIALAHPDLTYTHSDGEVDTLASYAGKLRSGHYVYHRVEHQVDRIVVAGDTAIVVGRMHADITAGGHAKRLANLVMAVWTRKDGRWLLLGFQPTPSPAATR